MNRLLTLALIGVCAAVAAPAFAQQATPAPQTAPAAAPPPAVAKQPVPAQPAAATAPTNAQQQRMKDCNTKAAGKKGDERKAFMSECLAGKDAAPVKMTQQEKMTACNKKAGDKKGDERKAFMSECLKG